MTYARVPALLLTFFLACLSGHAAEQDNWYLANEWSRTQSAGVFHYVDQNSGSERIYVARADSTAEIYVYEMNGTFERKFPIGTSDYYAYDLALDANGTIFIAERYAVACLENDGTFKWRLGKNASISNYGTGGAGNGEFSFAYGIAIHPSSGELFVADKNNNRVQVLDKNGSFIRKFGINGTAPGQLKEPHDMVFLPDGTLVVGDTSYLHYFQPDGTFIKRVNTSSANRYVSVGQDGTLFCYGKLRDQDCNEMASGPFGSVNVRTCFTPEGDLIQSGSDKIRIWKRAYRTKGLPVRNVIPQPAVRAITQRAGTNIIDLDFEIIDPDDANATVGILAAQDGAFDDTSKWILPQTWVDGTGSKIGTPITTNQVHRVSWNVKPDWPDSTGALQFEIICHDARRTAPVDLHFLTLPLPDGNLTISRSPLKDSDFENYFKFLLAKGTTGIAFENGTIVQLGATPPAGSTRYKFTNAGKEGREGPTWAEANASYAGTNLAGNVNMTVQGIQEWTVPVTGTYVIEAVGARGGSQTKSGGAGAYANGRFTLPQGEVVKILVGQAGTDVSNRSVGGGGGTFVVRAEGNSPLVVAGGGGGGPAGHKGFDGRSSEDGGHGYKKIFFTPNESSGTGGTNGNGGAGHHSSRGGAGLSGNGSGNAKSFLNGGVGGTGSSDSSEGGFGGGGGSSYNDGGGGGGGYSGGGGGGGHGQGSGGGGGSFTSDSNGTLLSGINSQHGKVIITYLPNGGNLSLSINKSLLDHRLCSTVSGNMLLMNSLGYRLATPEEVQKASEAATAGGVNRWTANRPIQPRNLPNKVNEYGFDTGDHGERAWWVVEE
jgi:hypothetical protein